MRIAVAAAVCGSMAFFSAGCELAVHPAHVAVETPSVAVEGPAVDVEPQGPLIEGPEAQVVDVEPPPAEREYVYDPGFPPGVYLSGGFYYYGGHRYDRNVFINRVVEANRREHRYVNAGENRRLGERMAARHREVYKRTGGRRLPEKRGNQPSHEEHRR
jgi:hypothetical protein